jgi:acetylornithine deacetylase/succinyl-diaminopimelate desuccinylase-like protein
MLDIRLPRGYSTAKTVERLKAHLASRGFTDIDVNVTAQHEPMRTTTESSFVQTALQLLDERGLHASLWPTTGGGGPWSLFAALFDMPVLFDVGLGYGGNAGMAGEYLVLDTKGPVGGLVEAETYYCDLLRRWSEATEPQEG